MNVKAGGAGKPRAASSREEKKMSGFDAIDRAVAILRVLEKQEQSLSLTEIAREVDLGQATTSRYLASLVSHGLVEKTENNQFVLGVGLYLLGQKSLYRRDVRNLARPCLEKIHARYNETVSLALWIKQELVVVDCIEATQVLKQGAAVGGQNPWHASSLGKAILAWLGKDEIQRLLNGGALDRYTKHTLATLDKVLAQLPSIRANGYAVDNEESTLGGRCVGSAIFDASGKPFAAISISGPVTRISAESMPAIGKRIAEAASEISRGMGFNPE